MFTINALDEEFAVATGSNVNSGPNQSTFDDPPSSSRGLSITANSNDPSPSTFSVGDTYDLAYGDSGSGTDAIFEDAEVIRSDALPGGGHVVVFEGINQDGELEQIVWTPGFDLESWHSDVSDQGATAGFYTSDQDASTQYEHAFVCFSSDTCIRTPSGDIPAGKLKVKDLVITRDRGVQAILWIGRRDIEVDQTSPDVQPIVIQKNAFVCGSLRKQVIVSPQHRLLLRKKNGDEIFAPAKAFVGEKGIRYMRGRRRIEYNSILLANHDVLDVSGLAAESFLPGPQGYLRLSAREILDVERVLASQKSVSETVSPARPCLGGSAGRRAIKAGAKLVAFEREATPQLTQHVSSEGDAEAI
ncbi:MAG: Hint domain-containing protein [Pseudomonadota bacterium]